MQLTADASEHEPSSRPTVPRLQVVPAPSPNPAPRWVEVLRVDPWYSAITVAIDAVLAAAAVALAQWWIPGEMEHERNIALFSWLFVPMLLLVMATRSMYRQKLNEGFLDQFEPVATSIAVAALATLTLMVILVPRLPVGEVLTPYVRPSELVLKIWVFAAILIPVVRLARSLVNRWLRRRFEVGRPALVVGSGPVAHQLISRMRQIRDYGMCPVGLLDDTRPKDAEMFDVPYLGSTSDLESAARATRAEELIIAPSPLPDEQLARTAQLAQELGLRVRVVPRLMDSVGSGTRIEHMGGVPLMVLTHVNPKGWQFAVKHGGDRVAALVGLVLISPLLAVLAMAVKFSSPGPIFFAQERIGRDGKVFGCLKFRTMRLPDKAGASFEPEEGTAPGGVEGEDRRTRIGRIMRKASLDELPQLINVLRGEMSLVGPRPERPEFVELFEMHVRRYGQRHRVKAGMTGWAQVHGFRGQTSIADRAEWDNYYIDNWSLLLDFKILILTVLAVLRPAED
ncbi:UDP-phosphate galactose phosphotransferase [Mycolicibacterium novocastrense]|uniref:Exopolysaccharide biosynthesis polyprenyl glycosylphosphotransferase n=1 Tax=Mycolicibacterium novocastrense TaxID=59813 RepID=A0AAW5SVK9_MYCNV|nr:UDP-phosphate galactose phosphotransferase [Mycolicibacterium novocastrense]KUH68454.1 UDP-phosphate galactose phosphotransferase [Mycolicibacterium novocastrense]KUH73535.1 UDP-phosphate galactose phosphotransferase [Mycolicibacterium novocastrense]MCV7027097.1 sugar transferase [Mycolicibacterium novocastrense]GAT07780.1 exopolysaccharide biosynthesis polyprenyl glycosylphosphotransferase [Mycolicibacterium novocastrense]